MALYRLRGRLKGCLLGLLCLAWTELLAANPCAVLPVVFDVVGGAYSCADHGQVTVGLNGSQVGVKYQLQFAGSNLGGAVVGTGGPIVFTDIPPDGLYSVVAHDLSTGCEVVMHGTAQVTTGSAPKLTLHQTDVLCFGANNGAIQRVALLRHVFL